MNTTSSDNNQPLKPIPYVDEGELQLSENLINSIYPLLFLPALDQLSLEERDYLLQFYPNFESKIKEELEQSLNQAHIITQITELTEGKQGESLTLADSLKLEEIVNTISDCVIDFLSDFKNWLTQSNIKDSNWLKVSKLLSDGIVSYSLPKLAEEIKPNIRQFICQLRGVNPPQSVDLSDFEKHKQQIAEEVSRLTQQLSLINQDNKQQNKQVKGRRKKLYNKQKKLVTIQQQKEEIQQKLNQMKKEKAGLQTQLAMEKRRWEMNGLFALERQLNLAKERLQTERTAVRNLESSLQPTGDEEAEGCATKLGCFVVILIIIIAWVLLSL